MKKQIIVDSPEQLALGNYLRNDIIINFDEFETHIKLGLFKETPDDLVKYREINGKEFPYVTHQYAEKALNFVFNFHVSFRIIKQEYLTYKYKDKDVTEAECTVEFTFVEKDGSEIVRTVVSGHKGYANPATTRADTMKAALSKAWTIVARTFGIGADLAEQEKQFYEYIYADAEIVEEEATKEQTKSFSHLAPGLSAKPNY